MFPNLKNKKFIDISNSQVLSVKDQFENIAILDNNQRIDVNRLNDKNLFEEYIDPSSFFDTSSNLNLFAEKIKSIPNEFLNNMEDDSVPVTAYDPEEERKALLEKANSLYNSNSSVKSSMDQLDKFRDMIEDDENFIIPERTGLVEEVQRIEVPREKTQNNEVRQETVKHEIHEPVKPKQEDPIITMFKGVKRSVDFKIDLTLNEKIPRVDFIEMMEDSYELSLIDYLASEFTKKILSNPDLIKEKIKNDITKLVYMKEESKKPTPPKTKILKEGENPNPSRKRRTINKND